MKIGSLDSDTRTIVIAEIGNNHGGDAARARRMIELAKEAGADIVKFQTFRPEHYVSRPLNEERFQNLSRWQLSYDDFAMLARHARDTGITFMSTPFDLESARFLGADENVAALKVASGDNTFYPLIAEVARQAKPMIISTGILDEAGIARAVQAARDGMAETGKTAEIGLMHCVCAYPVPGGEANVAAVAALARAFPDCTPGYSDHTDLNRASKLAVLQGARVIERHFTDDRNSTEGPDHRLSADPAMLRELVDDVRAWEAGETDNPDAVQDADLLGDGTLGSRTIETDIAPMLRRSVACAQALTAGHTLRAEDLTWVRPGTGTPAGNEAALIGRTLATDLPQSTVIEADHLQD